MTASAEFRAFISYCHADARFAARLQRRLEGYRLPRRLAEAVAPLEGQAAGRIGPVFRDRADLSAAHDLSRAVREAIEGSRALVVVASPDGARSQWVAREIALFRELHPDAPIFVALARGEPGEALPPALSETGAEPLAADFRREGDGRLAFLKIVAGIAGVPFDALAQRDAQRRLRSVTAVTLTALGLVAVMAALLVMAVQARREAERQRAEAEGLVEYMLTDLRERLKGVGRIEVMSAVNERAMAYYSAQDLRDLPDASLERRARLLHAMGEDDDNRADLSGALAKFTEAHRTTAAILAKQPRNPARIFAHAQSEYWVGYAAWRKMDRVTATRSWQGYLDQAHALAAAEPGTRRSLVEQGYAEGNLCDLAYFDKYDLAAAARHCRAAMAYMAEAHRMAPEDRWAAVDLANRHGWVSRVQLAQGDYAGAIASRRAEIALLDPLIAADPENAEYLKRRSWPDVGLATIWIEKGKPDRAADILERRWAVFRPEMTPDRADQLWETGLRMLFFLSKAQRLAGLPARERTEEEIGSYLREYLRMFPTRAADIARLRSQIET